MIRCMRCRSDMPADPLPLCDRCRAELEPDGVAIARAAYDKHQATGCGCDPKYVWVCRQFLKALMPGAYE